MGQISLPRLEKINTVMHWESGYLNNRHAWAAPKLFLLHKLFIRHLFNKTFTLRKRFWKKYINNNFLTQFNSNKKNFIFINSLHKHPKTLASKFRLAGHYIYHTNNKYLTLVVYSAHNAPRLVLKNMKYAINKSVTNRFYF